MTWKSQHPYQYHNINVHEGAKFPNVGCTWHLRKDEDMDMETIMDDHEIITATVNTSTNYVNVLSHWKKFLNFTNNIPTSTQWKKKKRLRELSWNINQRRFLKQLCLLLTFPRNETLVGISIVVHPLMLMENLAKIQN